MNSKPNMTPLPRLSFVLPAVVFFIFYFFYVGWQIKPHLEYHAQSPVFLYGNGFFKECRIFPGGLVEYISAFLMQLFSRTWLGAWLTVLVAFSLWYLTRKLMQKAYHSNVEILSWAPPVLLLLLIQNRYGYRWMGLTLALLTALTFTWIWVQLTERASLLRLAAFTVFAVIVYYSAAGAVLLFGGLAGIFEVLYAWRWDHPGGDTAVRTALQLQENPVQPTIMRCQLSRLLAAMFIFVSTAALPWLAWRLVYVIPLHDAYTILLPFGGPKTAPLLACVLYVFYPLALFAAVGTAMIRAKRAARIAAIPSTLKAPLSIQARESAHVASAAPGLGLLRKRGLYWIGNPVVLLLLAGAVTFGSFDKTARQLVQVDYYAQHQDWERVLTIAGRLRHCEPATVSDINRALCHTGQLLENMFSYPQMRGLEFWVHLHTTLDLDKCIKASDLLFELGQVNGAERMAGEALELDGYQPAILQRMFFIKVLKGQPQAARLFLNVLAQMPVYRNWAKRYQYALETDPQLAEDEQLKLVRPLMIQRDYAGNFQTETLLQQSLRQSPHNRMALDYLEAYYLLTFQVAKAVQNLARMDVADYPQLPRHCEEAWLLDFVNNGLPSVDLRGRAIRPAARERHNRFNKQLLRYRGNLAKAAAGLRQEFGDTYWYYYLFARSGRAALMSLDNRNAETARY